MKNNFKIAPNFWYTTYGWKNKLYAYILLPLTSLYWMVVTLKKLCYKFGFCKSYQPCVPLIVIGNLTVGGVGKTPFVIWLAQQLQQQGYKVGVVSRGYGRKTRGLYEVTNTSTAEEVGDEALVITANTHCSMVIGERRVSAIKHLLSIAQCDVILSDDGLQHYAMGRTYEIVIVDANREFGNNLCLPSGPLREPIFRLKDVDCIIHNVTNLPSTHLDAYITQYRKKYVTASYTMKFVNDAFYYVKNMRDENRQPFSMEDIIRLMQTYNKTTLYLVTGIGNPQRFTQQFFDYAQQKQAELPCEFNIKTKNFPDHHLYTPQDFDFLDDDNDIVIMTEKDAVKCKFFAENNWLYLAINSKIDADLDEMRFGLKCYIT